MCARTPSLALAAGWGLYIVAKPTIGGLAAYDGEWVDDARTGRGTTKGYDGHMELGRYVNGVRDGEAVRLVDESKLKKDEPKGPFRMMDGKVLEEITEEEALVIAQRLGFKGPLPTFPWPPAAPAAAAPA